MLLQASFYIIGTVCIWKGRIIIKNAFKRGTALILSAAFALAIAVFAAHAEDGQPDEAAADLLLTQAAESEPAEEETTAPGQPAEQETEPETTAPHEHLFSAWETAVPASNKRDGTRTRSCSVCGETQSRVIPRIAAVRVKYSTREYSGKAIKNVIVVKDRTGKTLKQGRDYVLAYRHNKNVGTATVIIQGTGMYQAKITRSFRILPQKTALTKLSPGVKDARVQWKAVKKQCSGYQVQFAADKAFRNNAKLRKIADAKKTSVTLTGLKERTTYYVRIRTFAKVGDRTWFSAWSKPKTMKTVSSSPHFIEGQLPKTPRVNASYFDDAIFVGDSVSLGLNYYEAANDKLGKAQFLTAGSMGSGNALQPVSASSIHPRWNGEKMKVEKAVAKSGAKKVYIMLGMNDIAVYGPEKSARNLRELCKRILMEAPTVKIFLQSVTPRVNQGASSDRGKLTNASITKYNQCVAKICTDEDWYFVNVAEFMFDSTGHLIRSYCSDPDGMGMHFAPKGCEAWIDYLYTHTV